MLKKYKGHIYLVQLIGALTLVGIWWKNYYVLAPIVFIAIGFFSQALRSQIIKSWNYLGMMIGKVMSPIILSLVFFVAVVPLGFFMKALGKDLLGISKRQKNSPSNLHLIDKEFGPSDFERMG